MLISKTLKSRPNITWAACSFTCLVIALRCWLWGSMDACSYEDRHQVHLCYMSSLAPNLLGNSSLMDVFLFLIHAVSFSSCAN